MAQPNRRNRNRRANNQNNDRRSSPASDIDIISEHGDHQNTVNGTNRQETHLQNGNGTNKWIKTDIISVFALVVNIILAIVTYRLFKISTDQAIQAKRSADAAITADSIANNTYHLSNEMNIQSDSDNKKAFDETKRYNTQFLDIQKASFAENKKDADNREKRELSVFRQSKLQFEVENRPFLQVLETAIDTLVPGKKLYISFYYYNYGKFPANVLKSFCEIGASAYSTFNLNYDKKGTKLKTNFYIANGVSQQMNVSTADTISKFFVDNFKAGKLNIFFFGYCEFVNPITHKLWRYDFKNRIYYAPAFTDEVQLNNVRQIEK